MKLENKKEFAAKVLGVGQGRIGFNKSRLDEIKEAMTRQDIKDLFVSNAIFIRDIKGRRIHEKRKTRRRKGSIRNPVKNKKRKYIIITRKLRSYLSELRKSGKISQEQFLLLRKEIRASAFDEKARLKDRLKMLEAEQTHERNKSVPSTSGIAREKK